MRGACVLTVFPAYAGMSRSGTSRRTASRSFPRLRGDEPGNEAFQVNGASFSPPTRG